MSRQELIDKIEEIQEKNIKYCEILDYYTDEKAVREEIADLFDEYDTKLNNIKEIVFGVGSAQERMEEIKALFINV